MSSYPGLTDTGISVKAVPVAWYAINLVCHWLLHRYAKSDRWEVYQWRWLMSHAAAQSRLEKIAVSVSVLEDGCAFRKCSPPPSQLAPLVTIMYEPNKGL